MGLLPLFQAKIGDNYFAARRQTANLGCDMSFLTGSRLRQPSLKDLELLLPVPTLPQLSMPLNDSAHAVLHVIDLVFLQDSAS